MIRDQALASGWWDVHVDLHDKGVGDRGDVAYGRGDGWLQ